MKMVRVIERPSWGLLALYRALMAVFLLLILSLLAGTLYALIFREAPVRESLSGLTGARAEIPAGVFTGIGRIRTATAGSRPAAVILSVAFPYAPEDRPFSEELAARTGNFRNLTVNYFAALSTAELARKNEGEIKRELLEQYNGILRLGSIEELYFNDYIVIE
ncbi:MAG: flagellar basal body protein FliL [Treponema sp.]|jgi:flagellar basal body-associated protein FliL|nr:flagellar basal body protein FliL [Treponema sp.]